MAEKEKLFVLGLLDQCQRCGLALAAQIGRHSVTEAKEHLANCDDQKRISAHQRKLQAVEAKKRARQEGQARQAEVQTLKQWQYAGSKPGQLWMLTEPLLRQLCEEHGLDQSGGRLDLIARLGSHLRRRLTNDRLIEAAPGAGAGAGVGAGVDTNLPSAPRGFVLSEGMRKR